ncbi:MAG: branched-chain amino acid ABC transporter permease [Desulfobacteraceae bacterium]|jgi:branched-chain amino acid transport system permease protein|nr:branched-chain amino acid ABC transporter permease [Desulfobacteraceae bacterium]
MPPDFIQLLVGGILLGGIYGLAAFGLSITFGVLNVLNLAHGEFLMLGALMGYVLFSAFGLNPFISAMAVIPIFIIAGIGFYFLLLKPISEKPPHQLLVASILVTLGASLIIEDLTAYFWERPVTGIAYSLPPLELAGVVVSSTRFLILMYIFLLAFSLQLYLQKTYVGKSIRGITQCLEGAKVVGIPIVLVSALTFGLGVALAASAGVFYVTLFTVTPIMGIPLSVKYMCIVVLGGLGSLVGSVVGGLILGVAESFTAYYFGAEWSPTIAFILLIVILIVKPEGLFGKKG